MVVGARGEGEDEGCWGGSGRGGYDWRLSGGYYAEELRK